MHFKTILSISILLFLIACSNPPSGPIELNDGQKWKVNAEMMPHLKASEKLISEFANGSEKDYQSLATQLNQNIKSLISSCNMKGKAHDELHKWLHPYMGMVNELKDAKNENEAQEVFAKIQTSFATFNQHFE